MKRILISGVFLLFVFQFELIAQQKFERESRLKESDVPSAALKFIESAEMDARWKWYFEENLRGNSVEAKTKHRGKRYSVEFDVSGNIQDIEIQKNWQELDEKVRGNITKSLDSLFVRHSVEKIQIQYTADSQLLHDILNGKISHADCEIRYEIVVKGKKADRPKLFEFTFSGDGNLLEFVEIVFRNTDNLEY